MTEKTTALTTESAKVAVDKTQATRDESLYIAPPVDIFESEDALTVVTDLPGVTKEDVDISVEDNVLTIKGKANYVSAPTTLREEFQLHGYYRQFQLSDLIDQNKISAETRNGVLTILLPKAEKTKPRQIQVTAG
ncbi:MAG: Hsp20/alpha crystallin family protein [Acidobacteriota bacterium]|jgi:HSP20 family protein|nr:Hsp20/alpha crystallin family protein [Acidobacteriota bacterium]